MKKRIAVLVLCFLLTCSLPVQASWQNEAEIPDENSFIETRMEGAGFDTPEEAVLAFCEALKENDFEKALSTFAIESYCEHHDFTGYMQYLGVVQLYNLGKSNLVTPAQNETLSKLNPWVREADIMTKLYSSLQMIALDNASLSEDDFIRESIDELRGKTILPLKDVQTSDLELLAGAIQQFPDFSDMQFSEPLSPVIFGAASKNYLSVSNLSVILMQAILNGASGSTELGVIIENDEFIYLLTMNVVKYGDKWYNCSMGSYFSLMIGIESNRYGLFGGPKELVGEEVKGLTSLDKSGKLLLLRTIIPDFDDFADSYAKMHEEYIQNILDEAAEYGLSYDPELPWLSQLDTVKALADAKGERFYSRQYISIYAMTLEEMLSFFSEEELGF